MPDIPTFTYLLALVAVLTSAIFGYVLVSGSLWKAKLPIPSYHYFLSYFLIAGLAWLVLLLRDSDLILGDSPATGALINLAGSGVLYVTCSTLLYLAMLKHRFSLWWNRIFVALNVVVAAILESDIELTLKYTIFCAYCIPLYSHFGTFSFLKAAKRKNLGYFIFGVAGWGSVAAAIVALYLIWQLGRLDLAYPILITGSAAGFVLIGIGFLTAILVTAHQQLSELALRDPLTGLLNRRGLEYATLSILEDTKRNNDFMSAIAIDIDHFKKINDTHGHDGGDVVLKATATLLTNCVRGGDVLCRHGGEEFLILLPKTDKSRAMDVAERTRQRISTFDIVLPNQTIRITASFGVSCQRTSVQLDELFKTADKALYAAKANGRNQVCFESV